MAPNVTVPMNFGKHHIGSRSHSNLVLKLKEGKEIRASSLILSFNSPVIERLTTELDQTSLDVDDFEEPAVQCYIVASYTGELEDMTKDIFRDVNKMAHVYEVSWLVDRCSEYFRGLCETIANSSFEEMFYLFEEARFVLDIMKRRDLIEVVFQKMHPISAKEKFVSKYMEDIANLSTKQLDLMLELAGIEVQVVVQPLTDHLRNLVATQGAIFTENTRYLLENANLSLCHQNDRILFEDMFDILQGAENTPEDNLRFVLTLYRESNKGKRRCIVKNSPANSKIPNLFHSFDEFKDLKLDELVSKFADSVKVRNMMMFAEGLYAWVYIDESKRSKSKQAKVTYWSAELMNKIVAIKEARMWSPPPRSFFDLCFPDVMKSAGKTFFDSWLNCDALFEPTERNNLQLLDSSTLALIPTTLFEQEDKFIFHFRDPGSPACSRPGECGFIIKTTPASKDNGDTFDVKLCTDHSEYPAELHFHNDEVLAESMHIMLELYSHDGTKLPSSCLPISWMDKQRFITITKDWSWGLNFKLAICVIL